MQPRCLRAMSCRAALVALRRQAVFIPDFTFEESTHPDALVPSVWRLDYSAVLIVPFGSNVVTEPFCTTTSVPLAISRVM